MRSRKRFIGIAIVLFFAVLTPLAFMQLRFDPIYYYKIRNDYKIIRSNPIVVDNCNDGYVTHATIEVSNLSDDLVDEVNQLSRVEVLRITCFWSNYQKTSSFDSVSNLKRIKELQIDNYSDKWDDRIISTMKLPDNITSLRIGDFSHAKTTKDKMNDEHLLELSRFSNIKIIMLNRSSSITPKGVERFHEIRPDVKVYWGDTYNPDPSRLKLLDMITY